MGVCQFAGNTVAKKRKKALISCFHLWSVVRVSGCRHVITYLLEHGMFDTNTLFSSEVRKTLQALLQSDLETKVDSKPPKLNKTEEAVEPVQSRGLPMIRWERIAP